MKWIVFWSMFLFGSGAYAALEGGIAITGAVRNPVHITEDTLEKFSSCEVQLNEIHSDKTFSGIFKFWGVPLKDLLELAGVEKKNTDFKKPVDLAVLVKSKTGQRVTLSWGELFYKNRENVIIATSARAILPHKGIDHFENKAAYDDMMKILHRRIIFPKLVVSSDGYADRSIEDVAEIEVYDLHPLVSGQKSPNAYSERIRIDGAVKQPVTMDQLPAGASTTVTAHVVGEGRGYHGTHTYRGISLKKLIMETLPELGLNTVFLLSAPDAYRALLSYGELFLNPHGQRIILADQADGSPIKTNGKFILILPDDLMADREVKAVARIEVISLSNIDRPKD